jgi:hypothetical protein
MCNCCGCWAVATSYTHACQAPWGCKTFNQSKAWCEGLGGYQVSYTDYQEQKDVEVSDVANQY